jgi:hypothetical protein
MSEVRLALVGVGGMEMCCDLETLTAGVVGLRLGLKTLMKTGLIR